MSAFDEDTIRKRLAERPGWAFENGEIVRTFTAPTFHRAIGFVVQIAMLADAMDHHPDLTVRYNRVTVAVSTHSAHGITEKDFTLAARIDEAFAD